MEKNPLRTIFEEGRVALNGWTHIPSTWANEIVARAGWDSVTIDMQHGMWGVESAIQAIQVIDGAGTVPIVRVNWFEPGIVMRMLDAGALGIICPMIDTAEQAQAFADACRFPPRGSRSLGPTRASFAFGADYAERANDEILCIPMVETSEAVENVEAIAAVDGVDMIFVGTGDLRLSLSGGVDMAADETLIDAHMGAALSHIVAACEDAKVTVGGFAFTPDIAHDLIGRGFQFVTVQTDTMLLDNAARSIIAETRAGFPENKA